MKFVKYNDNKSVTIPPAVLTVCGLEDEGKLEMAGAKGAVILSKSEMTAMEMVRTILALTDRAGQLMRELTDLCGSCEGCTEGHCTFRDADIEELIRPAVTVPDWAREEADIAPDAKLDCHVDEGSGVITVCETFYDHDLSDIPAELLEALRKSGCCLSVLEDMFGMSMAGNTTTCYRIGGHYDNRLPAAKKRFLLCGSLPEGQWPPQMQMGSHAASRRGNQHTQSPESI